MNDIVFGKEQALLLGIAAKFFREKSSVEVVRDLIETETGFEEEVWVEMVDAGCTHAVVEATPHGPVQHRLGGRRLEVRGVPTPGLGHPHLHGTRRAAHAAPRAAGRVFCNNARRRSRCISRTLFCAAPISSPRRVSAIWLAASSGLARNRIRLSVIARIGRTICHCRLT